MPIGTKNIFFLPPPVFKSAEELADKIYDYFINITGDAEIENLPEKRNKNEDLKTSTLFRKEKAPPTFAGLAFFLGFASLEDFDRYLQKGRFARIAKRGCLYVEVAYEIKLHQASSTGATFALKNRGWSDKPDDKKVVANTLKNLKVEVIVTGPAPASTEKEVVVQYPPAVRLIN
jgi:hypothetical protein